jgi:hypothetical protein
MYCLAILPAGLDPTFFCMQALYNAKLFYINCGYYKLLKYIKTHINIFSSSPSINCTILKLFFPWRHLINNTISALRDHAPHGGTELLEVQ